MVFGSHFAIFVSVFECLSLFSFSWFVIVQGLVVVIVAKMFAGIEFSKEAGGKVALVSSQWLTPRKSEVFWPPVKKQDEFDNLLKKAESPKEDWSLFGIQRVFFTCDDYGKANKKVELTKKQSDVDSEVEEGGGKRKRKIPSRFVESSSDEESSDEEERDHDKCPPEINVPLKHKSENNCKKVTKTVEKSSSPWHMNLGNEDFGDTFSQHKKKIALEQQSDKNDSKKLSKKIENSFPPQHINLWNEDEETLNQRNKTFALEQHNNNSNTHHSPIIIRTTPLTSRTHSNNNLANPDFQDPSCFKKIVKLLLHIREQNDQILKALKENNPMQKNQIPEDIPVQLPVSCEEDLTTLEHYLENVENLLLLVSYFSTLGGKDVTSATNAILRGLISNAVAQNFSFLGTRKEKKRFVDLRTKQLVLRAVQATYSSATEKEVNNQIKIWLKHAPQRLTLERKQRT